MTFAFLVDSVPFTPAVIAGETSLGGSESACLGLARALKRRGHEVHIFATHLDPRCEGLRDQGDVVWHDLNTFPTMNQFIEWDVVCALRMMQGYAFRPVYARMRLLWAQDLLIPGQSALGVMGIAWALDHLVYVSEYHRRQWEHLQPELAPIGWVTRNGYDPSDLPADPVEKVPHRIIHISRPERGLKPILAMWPELKRQHPEAELRICRYASMYDGEGSQVKAICEAFDRDVARMHEAVGGLTWLGTLNKRELYQEISEASVMWYPGVSTFAETSCIAAIEAQACGTPFVGSYRGALPETIPSGRLIRGQHDDPAYQQRSIDAVIDLLDQGARQSFDYRRLQRAGREHVKAYTFDVLAAEWEQQIEAWFRERYQGNKIGVLRQLLHEDDHVAAKVVARDIPTTSRDPLHIAQASQADAFCDYVIAGKDTTVEDYGNRALADPVKEAEHSTRFQAAVEHYTECARVLDVACGNGSFAIALALANPTVRVHGIDFSPANIERAQAAAERVGVADRCTFEQRTVYDFDRQAVHADFEAWQAQCAEPYDGLFCGEFIEHVGNYRGAIDGLEAVLADGAPVIYTCPHGACAELAPRDMPLLRSHVHRFHYDDIKAVWGTKEGMSATYLDAGITERGNPIGNWMIRYTKQANHPAGERPIQARITRTRPMPRLSIGIIAKDAENDLGRCLSSVWRIADEIVIGDTGSTDATTTIADGYKATVVDIGPVEDHPDGFAGARNAVLNQCSGDWFLWIDCDEQLINAPFLRRYLDGVVFNGFVVKQTHLYLDGPPTSDIPVRLFRNTGRVQFYGCIHEQPQDGDANGDIVPSLQTMDLSLAHTGYLTQEGREAKRVERNLPLLIRDQHRFADRVLGKVLCIREAVIQADMMRAYAGGAMTPKAQQGYLHAIQLFIERFDDPAHKYHLLARPWYEAALRHLGMGWEHEIALGGKPGPLGYDRPQAQRVWVRDAAEYERLAKHLVDQIATAMKPVTFITDPDVLAPASDEAVAV